MSVRIGIQEIVSGGQNCDRFWIERRDARYQYVAETRSLISDLKERSVNVVEWPVRNRLKGQTEKDGIILNASSD